MYKRLVIVMGSREVEQKTRTRGQALMGEIPILNDILPLLSKNSTTRLGNKDSKCGSVGVDFRLKA